MQPATQYRGVLALALGLLLTGAAAAQTAVALPAPQGVLNLSASAQAEVTKDVLSVVLSTTREGQDAGTVQAGLKQAIDAALAEARKAAKPGLVEVHTGAFSLYPRYTNKGVMNGWHGTAELTVQGKDMQAIAQLAGRLSTLSIARVSYTLSREASEKVEAELTAQAIARYRAKAAEMARQFGYGGYTIREVHVMTGEAGSPPVPYMRAKAMEAVAMDQSLPVEPGKGTVTATVNGSVQMSK
ncbi:MAG: SIMPL domain-containing protein [Pseudomonadota bacterium]